MLPRESAMGKSPSPEAHTLTALCKTCGGALSGQGFPADWRALVRLPLAERCPVIVPVVLNGSGRRKMRRRGCGGRSTRGCGVVVVARFSFSHSLDSHDYSTRTIENLANAIALPRHLVPATQASRQGGRPCADIDQSNPRVCGVPESV